MRLSYDAEGHKSCALFFNSRGSGFLQGPTSCIACGSPRVSVHLFTGRCSMNRSRSTRTNSCSCRWYRYCNYCCHLNSKGWPMLLKHYDLQPCSSERGQYVVIAYFVGKFEDPVGLKIPFKYTTSVLPACSSLHLKAVSVKSILKGI